MLRLLLLRHVWQLIIHLNTLHLNVLNYILSSVSDDHSCFTRSVYAYHWHHLLLSLILVRVWECLLIERRWLLVLLLKWLLLNLHAWKLVAYPNLLLLVKLLILLVSNVVCRINQLSLQHMPTFLYMLEFAGVLIRYSRSQLIWLKLNIIIVVTTLHVAHILLVLFLIIIKLVIVLILLWHFIIIVDFWLHLLLFISLIKRQLLLLNLLSRFIYFHSSLIRL